MICVYTLACEERGFDFSPFPLREGGWGVRFVRELDVEFLRCANEPFIFINEVLSLVNEL